MSFKIHATHQQPIQSTEVIAGATTIQHNVNTGKSDAAGHYAGISTQEIHKPRTAGRLLTAAGAAVMFGMIAFAHPNVSEARTYVTTQTVCDVWNGYGFDCRDVVVRIHEPDPPPVVINAPPPCGQRAIGGAVIATLAGGDPYYGARVGASMDYLYGCR